MGSCPEFWPTQIITPEVFRGSWPTRNVMCPPFRISPPSLRAELPLGEGGGLVGVGLPPPSPAGPLPMTTGRTSSCGTWTRRRRSSRRAAGPTSSPAPTAIPALVVAFTITSVGHRGTGRVLSIVGPAFLVFFPAFFFRRAQFFPAYLHRVVSYDFEELGGGARSSITSSFPPSLCSPFRHTERFKFLHLAPCLCCFFSSRKVESYQ